MFLSPRDYFYMPQKPIPIDYPSFEDPPFFDDFRRFSGGEAVLTFFDNSLIKKFGCRKNLIEIKCIWRASHYRQMHCHYPCKCVTDNELVVSSVNMEPDGVEPYRGTIYKGLTEEKIRKDCAKIYETFFNE